MRPTEESGETAK